MRPLGRNPGIQSVMPSRAGCLPVMTDARVGVQTGVAVVSTSLVLCAGFAVLAFAKMPSIAHTGSLTALAVAAALASDLILLPAVASFVWKGRGVGGATDGAH